MFNYENVWNTEKFISRINIQSNVNIKATVALLVILVSIQTLYDIPK